MLATHEEESSMRQRPQSRVQYVVFARVIYGWVLTTKKRSTSRQRSSPLVGHLWGNKQTILLVVIGQNGQSEIPGLRLSAGNPQTYMGDSVIFPAVLRADPHLLSKTTCPRRGTPRMFLNCQAVVLFRGDARCRRVKRAYVYWTIRFL